MFNRLLGTPTNHRYMTTLACVRDSRGAEKAAANEMDFRLNLPGPLNFTDESLLLRCHHGGLSLVLLAVEHGVRPRLGTLAVKAD